MTKPAKPVETPLEQDPVWDLVDKAPTQPASAHFARKTVQLARESQARPTWWQKLLTPVPMSGLAAATAVIALVIGLNFPGEKPGTVADSTSGFEGEKALAIQEALETEMLIAAADNPSEFSDQELVYLLGF